jgi:hypothetical protein
VARSIVKRFARAGGDFIDSANHYPGGESEHIVGDLIRPDRDRWVLATKYILSEDPNDPNAGGFAPQEPASRRGRQPQTALDRLHRPLLGPHLGRLHSSGGSHQALDDLVRSGKVLYIGISDTPLGLSPEPSILPSPDGHRLAADCSPDATAPTAPALPAAAWPASEAPTNSSPSPNATSPSPMRSTPSPRRAARAQAKWRSPGYARSSTAPRRGRSSGYEHKPSSLTISARSISTWSPSSGTSSTRLATCPWVSRRLRRREARLRQHLRPHRRPPRGGQCHPSEPAGTRQIGMLWRGPVVTASPWDQLKLSGRPNGTGPPTSQRPARTNG